ncbi:hypothetical protein HY995_04920 [Candidatus Micrarchaeota archaeon]|nr:hypothetical protein [Candidatus Micrarchaeota archaeon]
MDYKITGNNFFDYVVLPGVLAGSLSLYLRNWFVSIGANDAAYTSLFVLLLIFSLIIGFANVAREKLIIVLLFGGAFMLLTDYLDLILTFKFDLVNPEGGAFLFGLGGLAALFGAMSRNFFMKDKTK